VWVYMCTSLSAHMRVIEPMLFVMVISVALARSAFETESLFSLHIMFPKLQKNIHTHYIDYVCHNRNILK